MAACSACSTTILFGGVTQGTDRYCNAECHQRGYLMNVAQQLPRELVRERTDSVYRGMCPQCNGPGPVDVHNSYRVWSALLMTSWRTSPRISCRSCGVKAQLGDTLFSLILGWWGFPWGFIMTPVQIARNIVAMVRNPETTAPSTELERVVGISLAARALEQQA